MRAIELKDLYSIIYTGASYRKQPKLAERIHDRFPLTIIPAVDVVGDAVTLECLDGYLYCYAQEEQSLITFLGELGENRFQTLKIGNLTQAQLKDMLGEIVTQSESKISYGKPHKVLQGQFKNLIVLPLFLDEETGNAQCVYQIAGRDRPLSLPPPFLEETSDPLQEVMMNLINLQAEAKKENILRAVVIDGHYFLWRAAFGFPKMWTAQDRRFVGSSYGFYYYLLKFREAYPEYEMHITFDGNDKRKFAENPNYKAGRNHPQTNSFWEAMTQNRDWCKSIIKACGYNLYHELDKEGDDVVGSVAKNLERSGYEHVIIASLDTDFMQLVSNQINHYLPKVTNRSSPKVMTPRDVEEFFGINDVSKVNWIRAILGDSSDNIPSASTFVGQTIRGDLIRSTVNNANTLDELLKAMDKDLSLKKHKDDGQFERNLNLLTINTEIYKDTDLRQFSNTFDEDKVHSLLEANGFWKELEQFSRHQLVLKGDWSL